MYGFLIRKTFYDLWDNLIKVVIINLGFIAVSAFPIFLPQIIPVPALEIALRFAGILLCSIYLAAVALTIKSISDYGNFNFGDFLKNFKFAWPAGLAAGFAAFVLFFIVTFVIPFYMSIESITGLILSTVVFWTFVFAILSLQYYYAVRARLGTNLIKIFRKCMLIFLDNPGLALFSLIHNLLALALSVIFAFMFPGPFGILLFLDEALRLRLLKYDYLEANPDADRKKIPWDALLIEEREKTGTRSFRNFIFPWKD
jgi:hypothetical protein